MESRAITAITRIGAWVAVAATGAAAVALADIAHEQWAARPADLAALVTGGIAGVGAGAAAYLVATAFATAIAHLGTARARRAVARATPRAWTSLVSVGLGASISIASAGAAAATSPAWGEEPPAPTVHATQPAELASAAPTEYAGVSWAEASPAAEARTPQPQPEAAAPAAARAPAAAAAPATYVVRRGDSLWEIAEHNLGGDASAAQIDREWRRIWRANRDVVGDDPGLIYAGQRLVLTDGGAA